MNKLSIKICVTFVSLFCMQSLLAAEHKKPNIVFIMADDVGWGDVGYHGAKDIKTPNIDALAMEGARL